MAADKGHAAVGQLLVAARCNIDLQAQGLTALQAAERAGHARIATLIRNTRQKGAKDVLLQTSPEKIKKQQEDADRAMRELLEEEEKEKAAAAAGSQKKKQAKKASNTVKQLLDAAREGDAAKVSALLSTEGAQSLINYQDTQGATPLYVAAQKGHAAVTEQLIAACCNVDLQDAIGYTPLHIAARSGHESVAEQLLAARCNIDLRAVEMEGGRTALQLAQQQGHAGIATLIRNTRRQRGGRRRIIGRKRKRRGGRRGYVGRERRRRDCGRRRRSGGKRRRTFAGFGGSPSSCWKKRRATKENQRLVLGVRGCKRSRKPCSISGRWRRMRRVWQGY